MDLDGTLCRGMFRVFGVPLHRASLRNFRQRAKLSAVYQDQWVYSREE